MKKKMKKIAIIDYDMSVIGGVESVSNMLSNSLIANYEVYLISLNNSNGKIPYNINEKVKNIELCKTSETRIRQVMKNTRRKLKKVLKENKIEVAICMGTYTTLISIINSIGAKTKIIFSDHGALINQWNDKTARYIRRFNSIFAKHTVVLTNKTKEDYKRLFHVKEKKITQIYNSIKQESLKDIKEYKTESNRILTVGRFTDEKGFDMLVDIAVELNKINSNWGWDLYGDGPERIKIEEKVKKNNLEDKVKFKGKMKVTNSIYNDYGIYVLPSYREGLPIVLLEAKSNKLPIVSFDIDTGPNEIVENNTNGFLVKKYDVTEMARKIDELLKNKELRENFSANSYNNIEKFKENTVINKWIELIDNL